MKNNHPRRRGDLTAKKVDEGEYVVLDRGSNQIHQLNRTAGFIWQRCDGKHSVERIAEEIVDAFRIDLDRARQDAGKAVGEFSRLGLLEKPVNMLVG